MKKNQDTEVALSLMKLAIALLDKANERGTVAVHLQATIDAAEDKTDEERWGDTAALEVRLFPPGKEGTCAKPTKAWTILTMYAYANWCIGFGIF